MMYFKCKRRRQKQRCAYNYITLDLKGANLSRHLRRDCGQIRVLPLRSVLRSKGFLLLPQLASAFRDSTRGDRGRRVFHRKRRLGFRETVGDGGQYHDLHPPAHLKTIAPVFLRGRSILPKGEIGSQWPSGLFCGLTEVAQ